MESIQFQRHCCYENKLFSISFLLLVFSSSCCGCLMAIRHGHFPCVDSEGNVSVDGHTSKLLGHPRRFRRTTNSGKGMAIGIIGTAVASYSVHGMAAAAAATPCAHLATYPSKGTPPRLEEALDAAISDGVDAIVMADAAASPGLDLRRDDVAKAAFKATKAGILVSCPAGDLGKYGLTNGAPWILTVGASTADRALRVSLRLGGGEEELEGESLGSPSDFPSPSAPLQLLHLGTCNKTSVYGVDLTEKAVLCDYDPTLLPSEQGRNVSRASVVILMNSRRQGKAISLFRRYGPPTVVVTREDARKLTAYISSSRSPNITVTPGEVMTIGAALLPSVWEFSSRGPCPVNNGVLKPDVVGPGVGIPVADEEMGNSGTSTAASYLAGVAALLRNSHSDWSPAMIKSAIMTSSDIADTSGSWVADETGSPASVLAMGAGHVNPQKADDPGLVYDTRPEEYIPYMCGLGYTDEEVFQVTAVAGASCDAAGEINGEELNYPSILVALDASTATGRGRTIRRRVTNVGPPGVLYMSRVDLPPEVHAVVYPHSLYFESEGEVLSFTVTFSVAGNLRRTRYEGQLWWESLPSGSHGSSRRHSVRSPLFITVLEGT